MGPTSPRSPEHGGHAESHQSEPSKHTVQLLFVNYHYIRDPGAYEYPGIHPLSRDRFEAEVDRLQDAFHMATPKEVEAFAAGEFRFDRPSVFLTFDDGLVEHLDVARDVLEPRGIRGAFFIITAPIVEHRAATVHKIHWLRATTPPEVFADEFKSHLSDAYRSEISVPDPEATAIYPYDTEAVAQMKYAISFRLPLEVVGQTASKMLTARGEDEATFCAQTYLDRDGVARLAKGGHVVGVHGHNHLVFSKVSPEALDAEISRNVEILSEITGQPPEWISYPYGRESALPPDPDDVCKRFGFRVGVSLVAGWNAGGEPASRLNRINTNEVDAIAFPVLTET